MTKWIATFARVLIMGCVLLLSAWQVVAPGIASAQSASELDGRWRGESSGNEVRIVSRDGGFEVWRVTSNPGQSPDAYYVRTGEGQYEVTSGISTAQLLGPGRLLITNSDGWSDQFILVEPANGNAGGSGRFEPRPLPPSPTGGGARATCVGTQADALERYRMQVLRVLTLTPNQADSPESLQFHQWRIFFTTAAMGFLEEERPCLSAADYSQQLEVLDRMQSRAMTACNQMTGGGGCAPRYPWS